MYQSLLSQNKIFSYHIYYKLFSLPSLISNCLQYMFYLATYKLSCVFFQSLQTGVVSFGISGNPDKEFFLHKLPLHMNLVEKKRIFTIIPPKKFLCKELKIFD